jgi:quercetin dioxygenase-like cupin family protein
VANLRKLAQFFSVKMTHFFEGEDNQQVGQVVRPAERVRLSLDDAPVQVFSLLPPNSDLDARLIEAYPGSSQQGFSSRGSQMVFVLSGHVRYTLGEEQYDLEPGDTLFFHDDTAYSWTNVGNSIATMLTVNTLNPRDDR